MSQPCTLLRRPVALLATLLLSAGLAGCSPTAEEPEPPPGLTGLSIALRFDSQSDTAAIRYRLLRKSCSGEAFTPLDRTVDKPLEDILLPGGIPGFEDQPLDGDSSHAFADLFLDLPPGCYDVTTQPLRRDGTASQDCAAASASNVRVNDGRTTELFLINQCRGDGRGAIDVISALNHPPVLTAVAFERSKFVLRCEDQVVCATAKDPDKDPIEFTWQKVGGPPLLSGPTVVRTTNNADGSTTQCVRAVAEQTGQYQLTVTVYDLLHDPRNRTQLIRFEEYFARGGSTQRSRVELTFPFYAAANGFSGSCIAPSCKVLLERVPTTPSGLYNIDPDGSTGPIAPYEAYCDMTSDGGGWTLIASLSNEDGVYSWTQYRSGANNLANWRNEALFGTLSTHQTRDYKSPAFLQVAGQDLLVKDEGGNWARFGQVLAGRSMRDRLLQFTTCTTSAAGVILRPGDSRIASSNPAIASSLLFGFYGGDPNQSSTCAFNNQADGTDSSVIFVVAQGCGTAGLGLVGWLDTAGNNWDRDTHLCLSQVPAYAGDVCGPWYGGIHDKWFGCIPRASYMYVR